jgi:hypothetical protein
MKRKTALGLVLACLLVPTTWLVVSAVQEETMDIPVAEPMTFARVYTDTDGESHFGEREITFTLVDYAPPAPPISVSEVMKAENVSIISSPPGWFGDWHPAPRRQFVIVLSGELEVEVEDTTGKGHVSIVTSRVRAYIAVVPLGDE